MIQDLTTMFSKYVFLIYSLLFTYIQAPSCPFQLLFLWNLSQSSSFDLQTDLLQINRLFSLLVRKNSQKQSAEQITHALDHRYADEKVVKFPDKKIAVCRFAAIILVFVYQYISLNDHIEKIMPKQEEDQVFHFILTIVSVKMKVKFPCKMAVEQSNHPLTSQISPSEDGRFVFNQQVRLREQSEKLFSQLNICLVTQKGSRYISGIIKMYHNELIRSEAQRLVISLSKCLDTEAFCELRVDKIIRQGSGRKKTLSMIPERNQRITSPRHNDESNMMTGDFRSKRNEPTQIGFETKSESHFPVTTNIKSVRGEDELRGRDYAGMTGQLSSHRKGNISPKGRSRPFNSKNKYQPHQFNNDYERQKIMEAEVYRDNYNKIKQKYLKQVQISKNQLNKRISLQNNENNFKLQIVRLKIRNDELQKSLIEKNNRLKDLSITISNLQSRQAENNILRQDIANKEHAIQIMDDTIITLSKQNDELRGCNKQASYKLQEKILILQNQIEMISTKGSARQEELERQVKNLNDILQHKQNELNRKIEMFQKQKRNVFDLERSLQNKLFQYDSLLQNQRNLCKQKIEESKFKIEEANSIVIKINLQKSQLISQIDKLKGILLKNQYQFKLYQQQANNLRAELQQMRPVRDRYNEITKELRIISQQKTIFERNHQKIVNSKEKTLEQITNDFKKEVESQKRSNKQLEEKSKIFTSKLIEAESQLQLTKGSLDKYKKNYENISKQLTELKQRQKQLKKSLKSKEQECEDNRRQLMRTKQKNQSLIQSTKTEFGKNRDDYTRIKIQLQSQLVKNQQLVETNGQLNMELARIKMSQQFAEEKYEKAVQSAQQKYSQFQKIIKEHEGVIQLLQEKIHNQKVNQKQLINKLQKGDYQINLVFEKNDKVLKDLKSIEERNRQLEGALKAKHGQVIESLKKISDLQNRVNLLQQKNGEQKDQLQFTNSELQKSKKIAQIIQRDYEKAKSDIISYCHKLNQRQKQLDEKVVEIKKDKENISSSQNKYTNLKKEYEKFKDSVSEALNTSFAQVIQSFTSMQKFENVKTSNFGSNDVQTISQKRGITDMSNDLVNAINSAGKQNKNQVTKLNERVKTLEKDIQMLKNELEHTQQSNRRQVNQKNHQIQDLQQQLRLDKSDKGELQVNNQNTIQQLDQQVKGYQQQCQTLLSIKNELQFSINGLRMEIQRTNQDYQKRIHNLKRQKSELQQKLQYQYHNTQNSQKKVHDLQLELMNLNSVLMLQKQQIYKRQTKFTEQLQEKQRLTKEISSMKRHIKQTQEKYSQLQIQFVTIREIKQKYESMLTQQEGKLKEVRVFSNNILKQKQQIIKKQLQKNLEITQLENTVTDLKHSLMQEQELKNKFKSQLQQIKQIYKRYQNQFKDLESVLGQQKNKYNEIRDKLRLKEEQLSELKEQYALLKKKNEQHQLKTKNTNEQFKEQNNSLLKQLQLLKSQSSEQIRSLQSQLSKATLLLNSNKQEMAQLEQSLFVERQNNSSMQQSINKLKLQTEDVRKKLEEMEKVYEQLVEENKEKDEHMFEMGGKLYEYETRIREVEEEKLREIEELNNSLSVKYDEDYQEINQKIEFIEKEREYFKQKYNEKDQQLSKKQEQLKHKEIEQAEYKKIFEEKIKRLQEQKLTIFTDKNKQIAKIMEDNKSQFQSIRLKQSQLRRVIHQLQISRSTIQKLQGKIKDIQTDRSTQIKAYQTQIQNLRKKQLTFKSYKETVKSNQWNCERQVRKLIQQFIKKILEGGDKQVRHQSLIGSIKTMEQGLLGAISMVSKDGQ